MEEHFYHKWSNRVNVKSYIHLPLGTMLCGIRKHCLVFDSKWQPTWNHCKLVAVVYAPCGIQNITFCLFRKVSALLNNLYPLMIQQFLETCLELCLNKFFFLLPRCPHLVADSCLTEIHSQEGVIGKFRKNPLHHLFLLVKMVKHMFKSQNDTTILWYCILYHHLIADFSGMHTVYPTVYRNTIPTTDQRLKLMCTAMWFRYWL